MEYPIFYIQVEQYIVGNLSFLRGTRLSQSPFVHPTTVTLRLGIMVPKGFPIGKSWWSSRYIENILFACILASVFVSVRKWSFRPLLSLRYLNPLFEFIGNEFELGENKFERERETIIFSIRRYPLNSVIIFRKHHNIVERCFFQTRKHIEVGLNFSLAAGPKR